MSRVVRCDDIEPTVVTDCLVVGGGAAGLVAALAAREHGAEALVLEREPRLAGSTALSSGLIPAAETAAQRRQGIEDSVDGFCADILAKNGHRADPGHVRVCASHVDKVVDWLSDAHGIPFAVLDGFLYPGHGAYRMHCVPERTGEALIRRLEAAAEKAGVTIVTNRRAERLFVAGDDTVLGVGCELPDGSTETVGASSVILACNGYGGNPELVARHIPEMRDALYFGHPGNTGDAVLWGEELGAELLHLSGYQGHGSVAHPHGILITWALMMEGGVQVNRAGRRFSNELLGYSEQSVLVLGQPGREAWDIFDGRLRRVGMEFDDFRSAVKAGAVLEAEDIGGLAAKTGIEADGLARTLAETERCAHDGQPDEFGRVFSPERLLKPPYCAVRVTGALFHTQGGLGVDGRARVRREDGTAFPNLYACGGAACGVSGPHVSGYLSGNGLLTAASLGHLAGTDAGSNSSRVAALGDE